MTVAPHPHTGLQTVSWLFEGEVEHRDSVGSHATVRPGEINLMTAGRGISHSEVSPPTTTRLHGAQLWVVLPEESRFDEPRFDHYAPAPVSGDGWAARVFLGSLVGSTSPVPTATPLLGAELVLQPGTSLSLDVDPSYEHGVLVDRGSVVVGSAGDTVEVDEHGLAYVPPAVGALTLTAGGEPVRLLLLGGPPFGEKIVMWWNLIGRSHEEVAAWRAEWQAQIARDGHVVDDSQDVAPGRFGTVAGDHLRPIPAPPLPNARLKER